MSNDLRGLPIVQPSSPMRGLGDMVAKIAKPVAKLLRLDCLDNKTGDLKPKSPCAQRRDKLNKAVPFRQP